MRTSYIGTKIVNAEPGPAPRQIGKHPEGTPGYVVYYPDGYISWSPADEFERAYRALTQHEHQLMAPTNTEVEVGAINKGLSGPALSPVYGLCPVNASGSYTHSYYWCAENDGYVCKCGKRLEGVERRA